MPASTPPAPHRRNAFTLVEVLIVIGIIAVLIGILLPSINIARHQANTVKCMSNQKQLALACLLYARDNNDTLPFTGFTDPAVRNWAYDFSQPLTGTQKEVEGGQIWPYVNNYGGYHCPQTSGPYPVGSVQYLTNYVMSGAMSAFSSTYLDLKQFRSDDILFWEVPSRGIANGANDATNAPQEGVASRHKHGTTLSHIDGHVDVMTAQQFINNMQTGPSMLWADPTKPDGGISRYYVPPATPPLTIPTQEE